MRPIPESIEKAVRPFLSLVVKRAAEQGQAPGDYFLLLGKYELNEGALIHRSAAADFLTLAKSDARRRKYERVLSPPGAPNELVILVTAGDRVEGYRVRVPMIVPGVGTESELPVDEATARGFIKLTEEWLKLGYEGTRELGENPSEYLNYVQWPPPNGDIAQPRVFPRRKVTEELRHLHGTKKYTQLLEHLTTPCDDVMLFIDVAGREDILVMWRDSDKIPPFEMGQLTMHRKPDAPSR